MFKSIINKFAKAIEKATSTVGHLDATPAQLAQVQTITIPANIGTRRSQPATTTPTALVGKFEVDHLECLSSQYLKDALAGFGAWSALAKAFSEYMKLNNRKNANTVAYEQAKEQFHAWNAATSLDKQMNEETTALALAKIAEVPVQKSNDETDKIFARVLNKSVDEVKAQRIAKADKETKARQEVLSALYADIWQYSGEPVECYMSAAKAAAKAVQTMEWIAGTWQGHPSAVAAELLLIESDIKMIEHLARKEEDHDRDGVTEVGHSNQADYKHDPLKSQGINPNQDAIDNYMADRFAN